MCSALRDQTALIAAALFPMSSIRAGVASVGRSTAQGLFNMSTPVSRENAQPGDLIFFTGTYSAGTPVTHVGIYIGNGQMIHAGDPVQYANTIRPTGPNIFTHLGVSQQLKIGGNKLNPKIDKLARDIEKTEKKIADLQKKLELFREEKTRLENEDYGDIGRDFHLHPEGAAEFLKAHRAGTLTIPEAAPLRGEQRPAMKNKERNVLAALVLCMSAIALPVTAYASTGSDTTPPTSFRYIK